jgi:hypothetical protein
MARSKTITTEVKTKIINDTEVKTKESKESKESNQVSPTSNSETSVISTTNNAVSVEPVKGKRGRKSKKELMAALGVDPEMLVVNDNKNKNGNANVSSNANANDNNMSLSVTELPDSQENINHGSNIVIISNPNLDTSEVEAEEDQDQESIHKQVSKKRGRKPKGGKIIQQVIPVDSQISDKPNVILHLKCSMKDLQNSMNSNSIDSYAFNSKNNLCYDVIGSENINSVNTYFSDKNSMSSNALKTTNGANNCFNDYSYDDDEDDDNTNKDATKEIWKKLKQLEHNLHINNVNNKKSACFWDSCDFDNPPIYIPKHFINGTYHVYGCFCSPECGVAYLMNENIDSSTKFERYHLFNHIYTKIYDYKKNIKPSPNPHYMLEKFYGNLSIQEYRSLLRNERLFIIVDKPLTRILPELHDDNDDFILNSKIIPSNNNYQLKSRMQKKKTNKNSILNEKFGMNQTQNHRMIGNEEFVSYDHE